MLAGTESNVPPLDLEALPPPPAPPPGARARRPAPKPGPKAKRPKHYPAADEPDIPLYVPEIDRPPEKELGIEKDRRSKGKWYGAETLAFDGLSLAAIALGVDREEGFVTGVGVVTYLLATPIVHATHGKGGRGWGSFGLRLALPASGALVSGDDPALGAFLGALGATLIDAVRAYEDPKRSVTAPRRTMQLAPMVGRKGAALAFGGVF